MWSVSNKDRTTEVVNNLAAEDRWRSDWFRNLVVMTFVLEGLGPEGTKWFETSFDWKNVDSSESLFRQLRAQLENVKTECKSNIELCVARLETESFENQSCYARDTREKTRTTQWPNNPNVKLWNRDHYFEIYSDDFYRDRHPIINKDTPIGSAGSCSALRIAHQLQLSGFNYVLAEDDLPTGYPMAELTNSSYRMSPARVGTLFNVPSMRQMVERAFGEWQPEKLVVADSEKINDPFRQIKPNYLTLGGYEDDYHLHNQALRAALSRCDVFVLTLGLNEAWQFRHSGDYTSVAPYKIDPFLLRKKVLTVEENVIELERLYEVYRRHKSNIKFIISVSPVPLNKTFSKSQHVVEANCLSKSILRVAAQQFCDSHPGEAFYFPSFETVMFGTKNPWENDMRHVSNEAVVRVMSLFSKMFIEDPEEFAFSPVPAFNEPKLTLFRALRQIPRRLKGAVFDRS